MKSLFTSSSSYPRPAVVRNITETDSGGKARTAIVCKVKVVKKRQACIRILAEAFTVGERVDDVVKAVVGFCSTKLDGGFHRFHLETLVRSAQLTSLVMKKKPGNPII